MKVLLFSLFMVLVHFWSITVTTYMVSLKVETEFGQSQFWDLANQKSQMLSTLNFYGLNCSEILLLKLLENQCISLGTLLVVCAEFHHASHLIVLPQLTSSILKIVIAFCFQAILHLLLHVFGLLWSSQLSLSTVLGMLFQDTVIYNSPKSESLAQLLFPQISLYTVLIDLFLLHSCHLSYSIVSVTHIQDRGSHQTLLVVNFRHFSLIFRRGKLQWLHGWVLNSFCFS